MSQDITLTVDYHDRVCVIRWLADTDQEVSSSLEHLESNTNVVSFPV